ncbi:hypothetical protein DFH28DRAFT_524336 [Melampsora americana]|nr:hypothetical protein DFH28DRAFT_524336 [Melampsora americana]
MPLETPISFQFFLLLWSSSSKCTFLSFSFTLYVNLFCLYEYIVTSIYVVRMLCMYQYAITISHCDTYREHNCVCNWACCWHLKTTCLKQKRN